ncbi:MAG: ABC transporter permease, partial [Spirochaetes bacterium]|nr:ABC transporter permease [Spirochaetota bacterium]
MRDVVRGDLGTSIWSGYKVNALIAEALPHTLLLAVTSLGIAALIGIILGAFAAIRRDSPVGGVVTIVSLLGVAMPDFVAAVLLMLLFSVKIPIFPVLGAGVKGNVVDIAVHLVLPAAALGIGWVGYLSRLMSESMMDVLDSDYIRTARAFAVPRNSIVYKYALKNAVIPTISVIGLGVGKLLGGAVFVEIIFSRPGLGKLIVDAVF